MGIDLNRSLEDITASLIRVQSVTGDEAALKERIRETLGAIGFMPLHDIRNNLVYLINNGSELLGLVGHLDTVPLARDAHTIPKIADGELWGRGAADMKAGLACMLKLAYEIHKGNYVPQKSIMLVFYEGEEGSLPNGMTKLLKQNALHGMKYAFVLEPTDGDYHVGCLGNLTAKVTINGKAFHSASPNEEADDMNAVYLSLPLAQAVEKYGIRPFEIDGLPAAEIMRVTNINTENADNVVPPYVVITINYRFKPGKTLDEAKREISDIVCRNINPKRGVEGKPYEISYSDQAPSCYVNAANMTFLDDRIRRGILPGWTDIAQLNQAGIPAINFGPGSLSFAHRADERISINSLREFYQSLKPHL